MASASGESQNSSKLPKPALLVIVGEPHVDDHKELILQRVVKELASWDAAESGVDLNTELEALVAKSPVAEDCQFGEKVINYESDKAYISVIFNPNSKTLSGRLRSFFLLPGGYHHLIYSGLSIQGTGCWFIQDCFYTASAFSDLLHCSEISSASKQGTISGIIAINVPTGGDWSESHLSRAVPSPLTVRLNHAPAVTSSEEFVKFHDFLSGLIKVVNLTDLLPASGVVGNIRFSRPTIYIFPGGQGDSALFGVNGFNLLLDGGYLRRSCFWDFTCHLDRIDAILVTHVGPDNLFGLASVAERKTRDSVHPEIGHVFMNAPSETSRSEASDLTKGLQVSLADEATRLVENLKKTGLPLSKCLAGPQSSSGLPAVNLYHKVGHGSLDLYLLSPSGDSKALKDFFTHWSRHGNGFKGHGGSIPLSNQSSVCALLVWKPSSPTDSVTRILFPGTTPQSTIFEALDKMKSMTIFQRAVHTEKDSVIKSSAGVVKKPPIKNVAHAPPMSPKSTKVDKTEHKDVKKPPSSGTTKAPKELIKPHSFAKPTAKDSKLVDAKPHPQLPSDAKPHSESPVESEVSEHVLEEKIPPVESSVVQESQKGVNYAEADAVSHEIASVENGHSEVQTAAQDAVDDDLIGDLQALPEPNLLTTSMPAEDFGSPVADGRDVSNFQLCSATDVPYDELEPSKQISSPVENVAEINNLIDEIGHSDVVETGESDVTYGDSEQPSNEAPDNIKIETVVESVSDINTPIDEIGCSQVSDVVETGESDVPYGESEQLANEAFAHVKIETVVESVPEINTPIDEIGHSEVSDVVETGESDVPYGESEQLANEAFAHVKIETVVESVPEINTPIDEIGHSEVSDVVETGESNLPYGESEQPSNEAPDHVKIETETVLESVPEINTPSDEIGHSDVVETGESDVPYGESEQPSNEAPAHVKLENVAQSVPEINTPSDEIGHSDVVETGESDVPYGESEQPSNEAPDHFKIETVVESVPDINTVIDEIGHSEVSDVVETGESDVPYGESELPSSEAPAHIKIEPVVESVPEINTPIDEIGHSDVVETGESDVPYGESEQPSNEAPAHVKLENVAESVPEINTPSDEIGRSDVVETWESDVLHNDSLTLDEASVQDEVKIGVEHISENNFSIDSETARQLNIESRLEPSQDAYANLAIENLVNSEVDPVLETSPTREVDLDAAKFSGELIGEGINNVVAKYETDDSMCGSDVPLVTEYPEAELVDRSGSYKIEPVLKDILEPVDTNVDGNKLVERTPELEHIGDFAGVPSVEHTVSTDELVPERAEVPEELSVPTETPALEVHEQIDSFALPKLESLQPEPAGTNPFVGITGDISQVDTGSVIESSPSELFSTETSTVIHSGDGFEHVSTNLCEGDSLNPFEGIAGEIGQLGDGRVIEEGCVTNTPLAWGHQDKFLVEENQSEARLDRDSLERDASQSHSLQENEFDPQKEWDQPLGLPAPNKLPSARNNDSTMSANAEKKSDVRKAPSAAKPTPKPQQATGSKYQSKKDEKEEVDAGAGPAGDSKISSASGAKKAAKPGTASSESTSKADQSKPPARAQPAKKPAVGAVPAKATLKAVTPFYVDLAYVPAHGASEYVDMEFFRRVRARYYVLSTVSPDTATLGALMEAKSTWDDPELPVTLIPTYDADVLRYWMAAHRDQLSQLRIDIAPSANRCTIQLQDHDAGCAAFRLEF